MCSGGGGGGGGNVFSQYTKFFQHFQNLISTNPSILLFCRDKKAKGEGKKLENSSFK